MTTGSAALDEINQRRKQLQSVLAGTAPETPGPRGSNPQIEEIQNVVASHFNISRIDISVRQALRKRRASAPYRNLSLHGLNAAFEERNWPPVWWP